MGQCANSSGRDNRVYCYAELAVSSQAVTVAVANTHCAYPRRDGQAELTWAAWLNTKSVYPRTVTHLGTNPARRRSTTCTMIMCNAVTSKCQTPLHGHRLRTPPSTNRRAHNNSTTCCATNSPPTDILTCRDVGLWHCDVANLL